MTARALACALALTAMTSLARADEPAPAKLVVFVVGEDIPRPVRATTQLSFERALEQDSRLEVLDKDAQLAEQGRGEDIERLDEARGLLATGEALLVKGKTADALARLMTAEQRLGEALAFGKKSELARAQFLVGVAQAMIGRTDEARAAFVRLLTWRRDFTLDADVARGAAVVVFEQARRHVAKLPTGTVRVRAAIDGAEAYVDGEFIGFTPTSKKGLVVGTHYVTVRAEGYVRRVEQVDVQPGRSTTTRLPLEPSPAWDALEDTVARIAPRLGETRMPDALADLRMLLAVDHAVFLAPKGLSYTTYVYDLHDGRRLAQASITIGDADDPERAFAQLAEAVYSEAFRIAEVLVPRPKGKRGRDGKRFYETWWFWTGVGVAAAAVAVPLLIPEGDDAATCPGGHVCGDIVF